MNIYDYMMSTFGGTHLKGFNVICELIEKYDITSINKAYHKYAADHNMAYCNVERVVRHYIHVIGTTKQIEDKLKCKCLNPHGFSNKEFLMSVKERYKHGKK